MALRRMTAADRAKIRQAHLKNVELMLASVAEGEGSDIEPLRLLGEMLDCFADDGKEFRQIDDWVGRQLDRRASTAPTAEEATAATPHEKGKS